MLPIAMYSPINQHGQLTGLSATKKLDIPAGANAVIAQAITQNVRIMLNGNATASAGFQITAGDPAVLYPLGGSGALSVREETASATLEYQFVKVHGLA
jgi:hypothetical protein